MPLYTLSQCGHGYVPAHTDLGYVVTFHLSHRETANDLKRHMT